jgi:hypothetical protein
VRFQFSLCSFQLHGCESVSIAVSQVFLMLDRHSLLPDGRR